MGNRAGKMRGDSVGDWCEEGREMNITETP